MSDLKIEQIVAIEDLGYVDDWVYDIAIEDQSKPYFFGNDILLHNSVYAKLPVNNIDDAIKMADDIANQVNDSYQSFVQTAFLATDGYDEMIKCAREVVASAAIFVEKKRYTMRVLDSEGVRVDKLKTMGLEMKKTTIPKPIAKKLEHFVERILKKEEWNNVAQDIVDYKSSLLESDNIFDLGLPKGIKGVEMYTEQFEIYGAKARLPGHIAAAIHFNILLAQNNDYETPKIASGSKLRVFYLTRVFGRFKSIALPADITELPQWFISDMLPYVDKEKQVEKLIDGPLRIIFNALKREVPTKQTLFESELFEW